MEKLNQRLAQKARDALRAALANAGELPFRRSDVVDIILARTRLKTGEKWPTVRASAEQAAAAAIKEAASEGLVMRSGHLHWVRVSSSRKLLDGAAVTELTEPVCVQIKTKAPGKWLLVDRETGETWQPGLDGGLRRAPAAITEAIRKAVS